MRRLAVAATTCLAVLLPGAACAAELTWEVENPFRFFKPSSSFALHENAFRSLRGAGQGPIPADIVWRMERRLNDPDCKNRSTPDACAATKGPRYEQSRLGWASQTLSAICYDNNARPRRYVTQCERRYSWGSAKEDYILPEAHTVTIAIDPQTLGQVSGSCAWSWTPRNGGKAETKTLPCKDKLTIARVPFALDKAASGVSVSVKLPDGRTLTDPYVVVEDILLVALGDFSRREKAIPTAP